jgi:hypothetical protein
MMRSLVWRFARSPRRLGSNMMFPAKAEILTIVAACDSGAVFLDLDGAPNPVSSATDVPAPLAQLGGQ